MSRRRGIMMADNNYTDNTEKKCSTCEFNFGTVCAGYGTRTDNGKDTYGMPMDEASAMFPNGCEDWGISLDAYCEAEKRKNG